MTQTPAKAHCIPAGAGSTGLQAGAKPGVPMLPRRRPCRAFWRAEESWNWAGCSLPTTGALYRQIWAHCCPRSWRRPCVPVCVPMNEKLPVYRTGCGAYRLGDPYQQPGALGAGRRSGLAPRWQGCIPCGEGAGYAGGYECRCGWSAGARQIIGRYRPGGRIKDQ